MAERITAQIVEIGGAYYNVELTRVPRTGEFIEFYSALDKSTGHEPQHFYVVAGVKYDVTDGPNPQNHESVTVYVKPTHNPFR